MALTVKRIISVHGIVGALEPLASIATLSRAMLVGVPWRRARVGRWVRLVASRVGRARGGLLGRMVEGGSFGGHVHGRRAMAERHGLVGGRAAGMQGRGDLGRYGAWAVGHDILVVRADVGSG